MRVKRELLKLSAPLSACVWITDVCNLNCRYCYAKPFSGSEMDIKRLLELVDELNLLNVFDITIAGGEPLLHSNFDKIIERFNQYKTKLGILTNGVLLTPEFVKKHRLEKYTDNITFQISLDSVDKEINDYTRGKTNVVLENIDYITNLGFNVQISTVLTQLNIEKAHLMIEKFYPRVKKFHFLNVQHTLESLKHPELFISKEESYKFWMNLKEYSESFPKDLILPSLKVHMVSFNNPKCDEAYDFNSKASFAPKACSAGHHTINIGANLDVYGCDIAKDFSIMGNLKDCSLKSIWSSETADMVRDLDYPPCLDIVNCNCGITK